MLGVETFTLRRFDPETIGGDGRAIRVSNDTPIDGVLQPLGGAAIQRLEEGQRKRSPRKFYTETAVATVDVSTSTPADQIVDGANVYEVGSVERQRQGLTHYKVLLLLVQESL